MQNKTKPKDNQDYFNRVWQHFVIEKKPRSYNKLTFLCLYRIPVSHKESLACIVGCVMPTYLAKQADKAEDSVDTKITSIIKCKKDVANWLENVDLMLLSAAQKIHDAYGFDVVNERVSQLVNLAKKFNLSVPSY